MYYAKELSSDSNSQVIGIFNGEAQTGEFRRNYPSGGVETFAAFRQNGEWYAIYSPSYVALSILRLSDNVEIGSEDKKDPCGFCPYSVYIPSYQITYLEPIIPDGKDLWEREYDKEMWEEDGEVHWETFALLDGCFWAASWSEIQMRNISKASEGIITDVENWSCPKPARNIALKDAVSIDAFAQYDRSEEPDINISLAIEKTWRRSNGRIFDFENEEDRKILFPKGA